MYVVEKMFVNTADDVYITARWCFIKNLSVNFFTLANEALEKYLKAVLYANDVKISKSERDTLALFDRVAEIAGDLLPAQLAAPDGLELTGWEDEMPRAFVERVRHLGTSDDGYPAWGIEREPNDLFKLDHAVFAIRRLCGPLDAQYHPRSTPETYRDKLKFMPYFQSPGLHTKLSRRIEFREDEEVSAAALNLNLRFDWRNSFEHVPFQSEPFIPKSGLYLDIFKPLERGQRGQAAARAAKVADWVMTNVELPGDPCGASAEFNSDSRTRSSSCPDLGLPNIYETVRKARDQLAKASKGRPDSPDLF